MVCHTTLSIDNETYKKASTRAKKEYLPVSAIARILLGAYADGKINIVPTMDAPVELRELSVDEITPEIRKTADKAYNTPRKNFINI